MRKIISIALLSLCVTTLASAQTNAHPAEVVFEQWITALNAKDSTAIQAFKFDRTGRELHREQIAPRPLSAIATLDSSYVPHEVSGFQ